MRAFLVKFGGKASAVCGCITLAEMKRYPPGRYSLHESVSNLKCLRCAVCCSARPHPLFRISFVFGGEDGFPFFNLFLVLSGGTLLPSRRCFLSGAGLVEIHTYFSLFWLSLQRLMLFCFQLNSRVYTLLAVEWDSVSFQLKSDA